MRNWWIAKGLYDAMWRQQIGERRGNQPAASKRVAAGVT